MLEAAQRTADETVAAAQAEADTMLTKAREEASKVTGKLDEQRAALETKVNDLRTFERNYRSKLRDTISGQLAELDKVGSVEPKQGV
jgi:cell division septum initiation protein DivIVA